LRVSLVKPGAYLSASYGTAYYGLDADPAIFETAVRALAEGNALRATARIVQVDKDTVCAWLHRVACHCCIVMLYFWHDLHVSECQLDELWSFVHTPTVSLDVIPLVASSCWYYRGQIEPRTAHEFAVHVAT
jgi:hypothetical protein